MFSRSQQSRAGSVRAAFTLIELLVVIAIIAILAAILFPVFAQAREKSRQTVCLSNLKQIGNAVLMYAQDFDEYLVPTSIGGGGFNFGTEYPVLLDPYIKANNVWMCPTVVTSSTTNIRNIAMNEAVSQNVTNTSKSSALVLLSQIQVPASLIVMADARPYTLGGSFSSQVNGFQACTVATQIAAGTPIALNNGNYCYIRHSGGSNYAFGDGHAKWMHVRDSMVPNSMWSLDNHALTAIPAPCPSVW